MPRHITPRSPSRPCNRVVGVAACTDIFPFRPTWEDGNVARSVVAICSRRVSGDGRSRLCSPAYSSRACVDIRHGSVLATRYWVSCAVEQPSRRPLALPRMHGAAHRKQAQQDRRCVADPFSISCKWRVFSDIFRFAPPSAAASVPK